MLRNLSSFPDTPATPSSCPATARPAHDPAGHAVFEIRGECAGLSGKEEI